MTEEEFYNMIHEKLDNLDCSATPLLCKRVATRPGRKDIIQRIVRMVSEEGMMSIDGCIPHLEQALDGM